MRIQFICEGCDEGYDNFSESFKCETQDAGTPVAAVGDIVTTGDYFGWFDGDKRWVIPPTSGKLRSERADLMCPEGGGNCFDSCCNYSFYYVVTAIDVVKHRVRYFLKTRAMTPPVRGTGYGHRNKLRYDVLTKVEAPSDYLVRSSWGLLKEAHSDAAPR